MKRLLRPLFRQFHLPQGPLGHVVGWMLAAKGERAAPLVAAAALKPDERVLDVGCGPGMAVALAAIEVGDGHVTGIDPSDVMVSQARRRTRRATNVTIERASAEAIPLADDSVDVAWAINVLHHMANRDVGLAEIRRVLAPSGRLLIVEQHRHGRTGSALDDGSATELAAVLAAAGFAAPKISPFDAAGESHTLLCS